MSDYDTFDCGSDYFDFGQDSNFYEIQETQTDYEYLVALKRSTLLKQYSGDIYDIPADILYKNYEDLNILYSQISKDFEIQDEKPGLAYLYAEGSHHICVFLDLELPEDQLMEADEKLYEGFYLEFSLRENDITFHIS